MTQFSELAGNLEDILKLKFPVIGMKLVESADDLERVPRLRRPKAIHTLDQVVGQATRLGWTVGVTVEDLVGEQCGNVVGLGSASDEWKTGKHMTGVWYATVEDATRHQAALHRVPPGRYQALIVAPLRKWSGEESDVLGVPRIALFYATPGAMMYFINGLQWKDYKRFDWSVVGETACADAWGRALQTGEPSLSIPCFAERRYGGVLDEEMLMALVPGDIAKAIDGMQALARNGLRYPFPSYGIQMDVREGMGVSYPGGASGQ
jgi:uncharacterized protein (DUF169 family)